MKKIIPLIMLFNFTTMAFSQQIRPERKYLSPQEYRTRSADQIVLGSIVLAGGTGLALLGANVNKHATGFDFSGILLEAIGIVVAAGSIPLFITAASNHKKAKMVSGNVKLEHSNVPRFAAASRYSFPAISIKIKLGLLPTGRGISRKNRDLRIY